MKSARGKATTEQERVAALERQVESLEQQLDWFKRQLFGRKSEKRLVEEHPEQPLLDGLVVDTPLGVTPPTETVTYTRRKKRRDDECEPRHDR